MSAKTMRIIGWILMDIVCTIILFFIIYYGLTANNLNLSIYIGLGIAFIPPLVITFLLGRSSGLPSDDPVERLNDAWRYAEKIKKRDEKINGEKTKSN